MFNKKEKKGFLEKLTGAVRIKEEKEEELEPVETPEENLLDTEEEGQLSVDVFQTPKEIVIKTMIAGVKPEDLDVSITRDMVTIRGHRESCETVNEGDFFHQELYWGSFSRTLVLPEEIDVDKAEATEKHGLLILKLPKIDKNRQSKVKIKTN